MKKIIICLISFFLLNSLSFAWLDTLDFRVNDDKTKKEQNYPSIAANGKGRIIIAWQDYRNENYDIYA